MSCPHGNQIDDCDICNDIDAAFEAGRRSALEQTEVFAGRTINQGGSMTQITIEKSVVKRIKQCLQDRMYAHAELYLNEAIEAIEQAEEQEPAHPDRVRELECVIANLKAECQELRAEHPAPEPEQPAQQEPVAFHVVIDDEEDLALIHDMVSDGDLTPISLIVGEGHSGYGLYIQSADYPDEGSTLLKKITHPQASEPLPSLVKAAQSVLECTEIAHRPPVRDKLEAGRMVMVRLHALADLHDALAAHGIKGDV